VLFADNLDMLLSGSIGIEQKVRCQISGYVMITGGIGLSTEVDLEHDCAVCLSLVDKFGTCEYMHQANPSRCTCWMSQPKVRKNVQTVLQTNTTDGARLRYWREWAKTEGIKLGLIVPPTEPPLSFAVEMSAQQTSLDVAPSAEPGEIQ
jgi:hypothetical protein